MKKPPLNSRIEAEGYVARYYVNTFEYKGPSTLRVNDRVSERKQMRTRHRPQTSCYRPKKKFAKLSFYICLSVILFTGYGGEYLGRYPPRAGTPLWAGTPPPPGNGCWDTVNKRAVRILLECILVIKFNVLFTLSSSNDQKKFSFSYLLFLSGNGLPIL